MTSANQAVGSLTPYTTLETPSTPQETMPKGVQKKLDHYSQKLRNKIPLESFDYSRADGSSAQVVLPIETQADLFMLIVTIPKEKADALINTGTLDENYIVKTTHKHGKDYVEVAINLIDHHPNLSGDTQYQPKHEDSNPYRYQAVFLGTKLERKNTDNPDTALHATKGPAYGVFDYGVTTSLSADVGNNSPLNLTKHLLDEKVSINVNEQDASFSLQSPDGATEFALNLKSRGNAIPDFMINSKKWQTFINWDNTQEDDRGTHIGRAYLTNAHLTTVTKNDFTLGNNCDPMIASVIKAADDDNPIKVLTAYSSIMLGVPEKNFTRGVFGYHLKKDR